VKAKLREDRCPASRPSQTWAMDFVHDQLAMGKKIRILAVIDIFSRFSPVIDPRFSYRAEDVVMTLERSAESSVIRRRSVSTRAASLSPAISICGLTATTSFSTSPGPESRPRMPSSRLSTASSGRNA
jgi:putative transposase